MADSGEAPDDTAVGSSGDGADNAPTVEKLQEKIAHLEAEQQKQLKEFGTQRAQFKDIYHQKEEELDAVKAQNKKLLLELEEVRSELFALDLDRNSYLSEKSKCDDEIASLQKIVSDTVDENHNIRCQLLHFEEACMKLESDNNELRQRLSEDKDKERSSEQLPIHKLTQVTKSFARKMMSELGADSLASPPKETLDDDMRKVNKYAHEDAEVLRSLMIPLEAEIEGLKEKLRDADQRLRLYEEEHGPIEESSTQQENKVGDSVGDIVRAPAKSSPDEPLIQLSPSSPTEPLVPQSVNEAKPSPLENKDLEALLGSGEDATGPAAQDVPKCEMCRQLESELAKAQQQLAELHKTVENSEKAVQRARDDLNKERTSRQELETKWSIIKDQYDEQVANLEVMLSKSEHNLKDIKQKHETSRGIAEGQLQKLEEVNREVRKEIDRIQDENDKLLGKHSIKAGELQDLTIDLPDNVPELHELLLRRGEDLITAKISAETHEQEASLLRTELSKFQRRYDEMKHRERSVETDYRQLQKRTEEYVKALQRQEEFRKALTTEKEGLEKQLQEEINKKRKFESENEEYKRQVQSLQKDLTNSEHVQKDFVCLSQNLQKQLEVLRCEGAEVRWQHDEDVDQCKTCKATFNSSRKKVHCRHCGQIFCNNCLTFTVYSGPRQRPSRVCEVCHTLLVPDTAPYFSNEPPSAPD